jgi:hypothetical protein
MNDRLVMKIDIGFSQSRALTCVKNGIPLLVLTSETNNRDPAFLNQRSPLSNMYQSYGYRFSAAGIRALRGSSNL